MIWSSYFCRCDMHVVIATGIYPPDIGGPATAMARLVDQLTSAGHSVRVVTTGEADSVDGDVERVSRSHPKWKRFLRFALAVRAALQPDSVLVATDVFSSGVPARLALMGKRNRFLVRLGGEWCWEDAVNKGLVVSLREYWSDAKYRSYDRFKRPLISWILKRAQKIVPTSSLVGDVLPQIVSGLKAPVVILQNQERAAAVVPIEARTSHHPLRLLYVGRFAPVKNVVFFARVLLAAQQQNIPFEMVFVGDGPELHQVQSMLADMNHVMFAGKLDANGVATSMKEADVLALPSLSDVSPNVVYEALGQGLPCLITTEHGLLPSLGGVLEVSPRDERAWVETIRRLSDAHFYSSVQQEIQPLLSRGRTFFDEVVSL